jgi:NTP pyrophosphatase (non-canonical NTP hydrolase)
MDIQEAAVRLEQLSKQYTNRYNIDRTPQWILLKLTEEVGELMQAYLKVSKQTRHAADQTFDRQVLEDEMADVLGMTLIVAREFNLNIEAGLERKWFRHEDANSAAIEEAEYSASVEQAQTDVLTG